MNEAEVIHAMQERMHRWHGPLDILWRKPWKSPAPTGWREGTTLPVKLRNVRHWLRYAHDCADPSVGCSCSGGFRYPHNTPTG